MSTCYPQPGSVKIVGGETLVLESTYSSSRGHTGVMGLFYLLVADQLPSSLPDSQGPVEVRFFPPFSATFTVIWLAASGLVCHSKTTLLRYGRKIVLRGLRLVNEADDCQNESWQLRFYLTLSNCESNTSGVLCRSRVSDPLGWFHWDGMARGWNMQQQVLPRLLPSPLSHVIECEPSLLSYLMWCTFYCL